MSKAKTEVLTDTYLRHDFFYAAVCNNRIIEMEGKLVFSRV